MVARLLRAAGLAARHQSAVVTVGPSGATAWAVPAGLLDDGDAVEMSRRLGPARLLVHGELGPSRRQGMSLTLRVLRREDGGLAEEVARDFYEEELGPVVHDVARTVATLAGGAGVLEAVQPSAVLGTADPRALLRLQEGLDGVAALEGGIEGADAVRTAESLIA